MKKIKMCELCHKHYLVVPAGPPDSPVLLVGSAPGDEEMEALKPWMGPAGKALRSEFERVGLDIDDFRQTYLWLHPKDKECKVFYHRERLDVEMKGRKFIVLFGADVVKNVLESKVSEISSLVKKTEFGAVMAIENPSNAVEGSHGELRLGVERAAKYIKSLEKGAKRGRVKS